MTVETSPETALESPKSALKKGASELEAYRFGHPPSDLPYLEPAAPTRITDSGTIQIVDIDLSKKKDRSRFLDMPEIVYRGDVNYIAPLRMQFMKFLDPTKNPAFKNFELRTLMAVDGGKDVGRLTVHIDRAYNRYHESKTGFFGFFESINDRKVAHALLNEGTRWLKSHGCEEVFGPMNFTTNHQCGLLVENFDRPPFVEQTYNPAFYEELLTSFGFAKAKDLLCWRIQVDNGMTGKNRERILRISDKVRKREGVTIRTADIKQLDKVLEDVYDIYISAWEKNWGFVPLSKEEFLWLGEDFAQVAIPELVMFIDVGGKPAGFCMSLPNVNEKMPKDGRLFPFGWTKLMPWSMKKTKTVRLVTLGIVEEYRKKGLESIMFAESFIRAEKLGIEWGEIGWTLDDNDLVNRPIEKMDGVKDRTYRILGMNLGTAGE